MLDNPGVPRKKQKSKAITKIKPAKIKRHKEVVISDLKRLDPNTKVYKKLQKRLKKQKKLTSPSPVIDNRRKQKSFYNTPIPKLLQENDDKTLYIIGGGSSLKGFNWELLRDKNVLSINRAFQAVPWAIATFWTDSRFYKWYQKDIKRFKGIKIACRYSQLYDKDTILVRSTGGAGVDEYPYHIRAGNNSGFAALNVGYHLGANKIYLIGYDMRSEQNATHWHDGYVTSHNHDIYERAMIKDFANSQKYYKKLKVKLYNANPDSMLTHIQKCTLKEAINDSMQ